MIEALDRCQACLSSNRKLYPISKLIDLFQEIYFWDLSTSQGGVCWECHHLMRKFSKFKAQVRQTQYTLYHASKLSDLNSLSTLCIKPKDYQNEYQYNFSIESEPNTRNDLRIKDEIDEKKHHDYQINEEPLNEEPLGEEQTSKETDDDHFTRTFEDKSIADVQNDVNNKKLKSESKESFDRKKIKQIKRHKNPVDKVNEELELKDKFTVVVYTEEEMEKNRENKRSHPNFKKIPYKCDSCVLGFTRKDTFDLHMEKRHDEKIGEYVCSICQCRFPSSSKLARHQSAHGLCYRCKFCKYATLQARAAAAHARTKHVRDAEARVHCPHCALVAKTPDELSHHIIAEHSVYCDQCGEKFKGPHSLKSHTRRIHRVKREFICDMCSKAFNTKSRLESHMAHHNTTVAQKLAYCASCQVQYKNLYVYRNHLRTSANHAEQTYQCMDCNKRFASKVYWKKHYKFYHLQESSFRCGVCNKLFISDSRLRLHMQTKHGSDRTRDHHCNVCGKQFFTLATLKGHELTHSDQRSFMCEDCGDTFKQRPALYTHYKLVHRGLKRRRTAA